MPQAFQLQQQKKWLSILVSSHIIALVQPYHNNALKRVVKMPLIHFLDTGLAAYLLKWGNPEALERSAMSGAFFESYVFSEIYKSYLNAGKEPPIFYIFHQASPAFFQFFVKLLDFRFMFSNTRSSESLLLAQSVSDSFAVLGFPEGNSDRSR